MNMFIRLLLASVIFAWVGAVGAHGGVLETASTVKAAPNPQPSTVARELTTWLLDANGRYATAASPNRGQALAELLAVAQDRHSELLGLVESDPAEFLRVALPAALRAGLPPQALPFIEQPADESGELEVFHVDHVTPSDDYYQHFLNTTKGRFSLHFAGAAPDFVTGAKIQVRGMKIGNAIVVADRGDIIVTKAVAVLGNTLGVQKTLAILVNFSNAPTQPYTTAYAQSVMFGTTSNYDYEASYQQTTLAGAVAGWFTIAATSTTCDYPTIATQAKQAATAAGYVLSNYNRYVYVFPPNTCAWWGMGSVGGNPSQAWIHTKWGFTLPVIGHEMGHNFGLYHSHSLDCGSTVVASSGCTVSDYGDYFDMMGGGSNTSHYSAYQKERLGWLNAGVSPPITTVPTTQGTTTYSIAPMENARDGVPRALKIPRGTACSATNEWFYVESRQAKGFDTFLSSNANVLGGVLIHKVTEGNTNSSYLLDLTPATSSWSDPALVAGQSYTDPVTGLTIKPLSVGTAGAQVSVTFPASSCVRAKPAVTMTPTGTVWTSAGATTTYAVTVSNKDSCGCSATTFDIGAAVPAGWAASAARTASIVPGNTTSSSVTVTTASSAPPTFYPVTVNTASTMAPALITSVAGTIAVATALTVTATTDQTAYTLPTNGNSTIYATIRTKVTSGGAAIAGAAVSVRVTDPANAVTTLAATTDSAGNATVSYALRARKAKKGTYGVSSKATMGTMSSTGTTSFVVK